MKRWYKQAMTAVLAAVLLLCTGCSLDVEQYLRPPQTHGAQQAAQQALEKYIQDSGKDGNRYTLCYPVEGEHTAAFILCDATGRPVMDEPGKATMAVAFYALDTAPNDTHIHLLHRAENEWVSIADTVGGSSAILQAAFGDLDGDGIAELVTGWDTYNTRDRRLDVFSLANGLATVAGSRVYNRLYTGALTADKRDSLVLLRVENGAVSASLNYVTDGALYTEGQVWLDSDIQQFTGITRCQLDEDTVGLYLDAIKNTDTAITELLYIEDGMLRAPYCNQTRRLNTATARPVGFAMRDVDGDGRMEIPQCRLLDGYNAGDSTPDYAYLTDWMSWDRTTGIWSVAVSTVLNVADGYYITVDGAQREAVTTTYDEKTHRLTLLTVADAKPLVRLQPIAEEREDGYTVLFRESDEYAGCEVWFDDARLTADAVRDMVVRWEA